MLTSNQRGRGNEPVVVLGRIKSVVAVNMDFSVWANILGLGRRSGQSVGGFSDHIMKCQNIPGSLDTQPLRKWCWSYTEATLFPWQL